jgi:hypothetical protein
MTRTARTAVLALATAALAAFFPSPASAADGHPGAVAVGPAELSSAVAAARTPQAVSIARTNLGQRGFPEPATVAVAGSGIPAYTLDPGFVRGDPGAPAGRLAYVAVVATAPDGRRATIQATPDPVAGWAVGGVLSGDDENRLGKELPPGGVLLNEPQINGWYALTADGVRLLQASLPQNPAGQLIPLADYQRQVHARYADKFAGSDYQREGKIGFVQPTPAPPHANPAGRSTGDLAWWGAGAVGVLLAAAVAALRRHRRSPR